MTTAEILAAATWKCRVCAKPTGDGFTCCGSTCLRCEEQRERIINALTEALNALLDDDVVNRNMARKDVIAARAALALAKEAQE